MLMNEIEALIYVSGDKGITIKELETLTGSSQAAVRENIIKLQREYQNRNSALLVLQTGSSVQLATKSEFNELIQIYSKSDENLLSQAALETLTIIAYKQPITRIAVDEIRGINSSVSIRNLLNLNLIKEKGKADEPGTPALYATTDLFLQAFGLNNLKQLPEIKEDEVLGQNQEEMFNQSIDLLEKEDSNE